MSPEGVFEFLGAKARHFAVTKRTRGQSLGTIWPRVQIPHLVGVAPAAIVPISRRDYW